MSSHVPLNGGKRAGDNLGGEHGMSSHVRGGRRVGGRGKNKLLPPQPGGTWDELPCPSFRGGAWNKLPCPLTGEGQHKAPPLNQGEGTCTCQYDEWAHTVPPIYNRGRGFMLPLPLLGGHGSLSHAPLRGDMGAHPMSPQLRREGLIFAPPSPLSPLGDLSHSSPLSHGSSSHVPPLGYLPLSSPPQGGTWELIPCSPGGPVKGGTWEPIPCPPRVDPMPLPLVGNMGAHPMSPVRERNTLCVPLPKNGGGGGGGTGDVPVSLPLVPNYCLTIVTFNFLQVKLHLF